MIDQSHRLCHEDDRATDCSEKTEVYSPNLQNNASNRNTTHLFTSLQYTHCLNRYHVNLGYRKHKKLSPQHEATTSTPSAGNSAPLGVTLVRLWRKRSKTRNGNPNHDQDQQPNATLNQYKVDAIVHRPRPRYHAKLTPETTTTMIDYNDTNQDTL